MTHIAIQEALDGKNVIWMEKVTDEQYLAGPGKWQRAFTTYAKPCPPGNYGLGERTALGFIDDFVKRDYESRQATKRCTEVLG